MGCIHSCDHEDQEYGPKSQMKQCQYCGYRTHTVVTDVPSLATHCCANLCCLLGCVICSWIPYCTKTYYNTRHYCSRCNSYHGLYRYEKRCCCVRHTNHDDCTPGICSCQCDYNCCDDDEKYCFNCSCSCCERNCCGCNLCAYVCCKRFKRCLNTFCGCLHCRRRREEHRKYCSSCCSFTEDSCIGKCCICTCFNCCRPAV